MEIFRSQRGMRRQKQKKQNPESAQGFSAEAKITAERTRNVLGYLATIGEVYRLTDKEHLRTRVDASKMAGPHITLSAINERNRGGVITTGEGARIIFRNIQLDEESSRLTITNVRTSGRNQLTQTHVYDYDDSLSSVRYGNGEKELALTDLGVEQLGFVAAKLSELSEEDPLKKVS